MKKILFTIAVIFGIGLPTTYAQSDSVGHPWLIEELQQVKTAKDSAVVYYKDFVYSHSGMYYSHNLVYSSKISKKCYVGEVAVKFCEMYLLNATGFSVQMW